MNSPAFYYPKELKLIKGGHTYIFRYESGREDDLLAFLVEKVEKNEGFDWFDAAILANQAGLKGIREKILGKYS